MSPPEIRCDYSFIETYETWRVLSRDHSRRILIPSCRSCYHSNFYFTRECGYRFIDRRRPYTLVHNISFISSSIVVVMVGVFFLRDVIQIQSMIRLFHATELFTLVIQQRYHQGMINSSLHLDYTWTAALPAWSHRITARRIGCMSYEPRLPFPRTIFRRWGGLAVCSSKAVWRLRCTRHY